MTLQEIYECFDRVGCVVFSTRDGDGIESRIAHFFAWDDEGLYLRTMCTKPFYRQLKQYGRLSVCGMYPVTQVTHDADNLPSFQPGYTIRVAGEVRELSMTEVERKAEHDRNFTVAVHDIKKYPATRIFVLHKAQGELYDYDFACERRDHKLERRRFAYGGATFTQPGLTVGDACVGCGSCLSVCTFNAIEEGTPYRINGTRCDECGNCRNICPVDAVRHQGA